jgi:protein O-GlcNAc transferase
MMSRKLISFSLYGSNPLYLEGSLRNAQLAPSIYPGWRVRFYASQEIDDSLVRKLVDTGAEVVRKERRGEIDGMFWRFLPAADSSLEAVIVRDVDSRFTHREALAVREWIASGRALHIMRDHPCHRVVIMAGMCGIRGGAVPDIEQKIGAWSVWHRKGHDQDFMRDQIYPRLKHSLLVHSDLFAYQGEDCRPFPIPRERGHFVGCVIDPDRDEPTERQAREHEALFEDRSLQRLGPAKRRPRWAVHLEHLVRVWTGRAKSYSNAA